MDTATEDMAVEAMFRLLCPQWQTADKETQEKLDSALACFIDQRLYDIANREKITTDAATTLGAISAGALLSLHTLGHDRLQVCLLPAGISLLSDMLAGLQACLRLVPSELVTAADRQWLSIRMCAHLPGRMERHRALIYAEEDKEIDDMLAGALAYTSEVAQA
jgi:hypothetical protein